MPNNDAKRGWEYDVASSVDRDFDVGYEIYAPTGQHVGQVLAVPNGSTVLRVFPSTSTLEIPTDWLMDLLDEAKHSCRKKE